MGGSQRHLGRRPGGVEPAASPQPVGRRVPLVVGPAADPLVEGAVAAAPADPPDEALRAVETGGDQGGDVPVAAVLPQDGGGLPDGADGVVGPGQRGVRGAEHPAGDRHMLGRRPQQRGQLREPVRADPGDQRTERGAGAVEPDGQGPLRGDPGPDIRQHSGHHDGRESEEGPHDRPGPDRPQRRRPAGEVPAPVAPQPGILPRRQAGRREIGDGVHRLEQSPHLLRAGGALSRVHLGHALTQLRRPTRVKRRG